MVPIPLSNTATLITPTMVFPPMANYTPAITGAPYKLNGKIPTFSGKMLENIGIWLQQMDDLFTAAQIPEVDQKNNRTALMTPHLLESANGFYWSFSTQTNIAISPGIASNRK